MAAKETDFYVLKMNKETGDMYAVKKHGAEFIHKGSPVRVYIDENHVMRYIDPKSGVAFDGYALPFIRNYEKTHEKNFLRSAERYIEWHRFKKYQETIVNNPEAHFYWIRKFEAAPKCETDQEAMNGSSV